MYLRIILDRYLVRLREGNTGKPVQDGCCYESEMKMNQPIHFDDNVFFTFFTVIGKS